MKLSKIITGRRWQPRSAQLPEIWRVEEEPKVGLTNCKPSNLYSNAVVGDSESCLMDDRLTQTADVNSRGLQVLWVHRQGTRRLLRLVAR
jgi:hypothetical protein